jgi:hypothetical protein
MTICYQEQDGTASAGFIPEEFNFHLRVQSSLMITELMPKHAASVSRIKKEAECSFE